jgi:hypothetical protein
MQRLLVATFLVYTFAFRIGPPPALDAPTAAPEVAGTWTVTPSLRQVPGVHVLPANNNLDVTRHRGRTYLAFRTAPNHFASTDARLYVLSSADERNWRLETSVSEGSDVREPRLLPMVDQLFLYFAVLGSNAFAFEPREMRALQRSPEGVWGQPRTIYRPGYIPWRAKTIAGKPYLIAYGDGRHIYSRDGVPLQVHWLTSTDGWKWEPVVPGQPAVLEGGGSEADFELLEDGTVVSVVRNEAGDGGGWGAKVCRAEASAPGRWHCRNDPRKFDSPLLFQRDGKLYLVARRHLRGSGAYDLQMRRLPAGLQTMLYQLDYWRYPKRCAVWTVDPQSLEVTWQMDLPSRGDTCFPAVSDAGPGAVNVYNYSSPLDGPDLPWVAGQLGRTEIYRSLVRLDPGR